MPRSLRSLLAVPFVLSVAHSGGSPSDGPLDIVAALRGLERLTATLEPVGEFEPLSPCPVADRRDVVAALGSAGVDSPIATFDRIAGPALGPGLSGVECEGVYIGSEGDETFPETVLSLIVAELANPDLQQLLDGERPESLPTPTIGGGTVGVCREVDRHTECAEYWASGTFLVGISLDDRVFVDRPTASAVLVDLVPAVVEVLTAVSAVDPPVELHATAEQLAAARSGLASLVGAPIVPAVPGACSMLDQRSVDTALAEAGIDTVIEGWFESLTIGSDAMGDPDADAVGLRCRSGDDHGAITVVTIDYHESAVAQAVIELVHGCERVGSTVFCVETWEADGLTVAVTLTGPDAERDVVAALVVALVPIVLDNLAAAARPVS